jgi:hypothetical protein
MAMTEQPQGIRDGVAVHDEQVAQAAAAVAAAVPTADQQQQQAFQFLNGPGEGGGVQDGPADAPSQ